MRRCLKNVLHWGKKIYQFRCDRMTEEQRTEFLSLQSRLVEVKKTWKRNAPMPADLETTLDTFDTRLITYGEPFYRNVPISVSRMFSENAEVVWVAMFAALVIRTFFFQPFRIPTCSMFPSFSGMVTRLHKDTDPKVSLWKVPFRWVATGETNYRRSRVYSAVSARRGDGGKFADALQKGKGDDVFLALGNVVTGGRGAYLHDLRG